jgi:hypothetical protein
MENRYPTMTTAAVQITHHEMYPDKNRRTIQNTRAWTRAVVMSPWALFGRESRTPGVNRTKRSAVVRRSYIYENGT